jgi:hypothetical protein
MSLAERWLDARDTGDGVVNFADFAAMASQWQQ